MPDYCEESVTVIKRWFNADDPGVEFAEGDDFFLNDCHGKRVKLSDVILASHANYLKRDEQMRRAIAERDASDLE